MIKGDVKWWKIILKEPAMWLVVLALLAIVATYVGGLIYSNWESKASDLLRNRRIEKILKDKSDIFKKKYRAMYMYSVDRGKVKLRQVWKEKVQESVFTSDPCSKLITKPVKLSGNGFAVFHNALIEAISLEANAIRLGNDKGQVTSVDFYNCTWKR